MKINTKFAIALNIGMTVVAGYHLPTSPKRDTKVEGDAIALGTRSLLQRDPPEGWSIHVAEGNDGGGCYDDSPTARILDGYWASDAGNRLDICLSICHGKGFKYSGLQFGTQCFASPRTSSHRLTHTDLPIVR